MSSQHQDERQTGDRLAPEVGGTSTPISGSKDGTGEQDPVMSEEAGRSGEGRDDPSSQELTGSRTDAPGYGTPS